MGFFGEQIEKAKNSKPKKAASDKTRETIPHLLYGSLNNAAKAGQEDGSTLCYDPEGNHKYRTKRSLNAPVIAEMIVGEIWADKFSGDETLERPSMVPLDYVKPARRTFRPIRDRFFLSEYAPEFWNAVGIVRERDDVYSNAIDEILDELDVKEPAKAEVTVG